ncbi:GYF domain-containing protein [Chondromyces crocatus]|uniref:GYF domain-containing protein n=1 Tax=Chondromyces crocatus TaxID=52 RepID=A0A0K1ERZ0_CHOCO|nr:GYF domain-containing protein [Chondromyces crocatus]AKT43427.1 uncharacterized protein CMC5_076590 [Chondromyces crocatus]
MSTPEEWRWTDELGVQRRVSTEELHEALASGLLSGSTLVWQRGMSAWAPAHEVPELAQVILTRDDGELDTITEATLTEPGRVIQESPGAPGAPGQAPVPAERGLPTSPAITRGAARARVSAGEARARAVMQTLVGLEGEGQAIEAMRSSASTPPIAMPAVGGAPEPGARAIITRPPQFGPSESRAGAGLPGGGVIPPAPRVPGLFGGNTTPGAGGATRAGAQRPEGSQEKAAPRRPLIEMPGRKPSGAAEPRKGGAPAGAGTVEEALARATSGRGAGAGANAGLGAQDGAAQRHAVRGPAPQRGTPAQGEQGTGTLAQGAQGTGAQAHRAQGSGALGQGPHAVQGQAMQPQTSPGLGSHAAQAPEARGFAMQGQAPRAGEVPRTGRTAAPPPQRPVGRNLPPPPTLTADPSDAAAPVPALGHPEELRYAAGASRFGWAPRAADGGGGGERAAGAPVDRGSPGGEPQGSSTAASASSEREAPITQPAGGVAPRGEVAAERASGVGHEAGEAAPRRWSSERSRESGGVVETLASALIPAGSLGNTPPAGGVVVQRDSALPGGRESALPGGHVPGGVTAAGVAAAGGGRVNGSGGSLMPTVASMVATPAHRASQVPEERAPEGSPESWTAGSRSGGSLLHAQVRVPVSSLLGTGGTLIVLVLIAFLAGRCSVGDRGRVEVAHAGLLESALGPSSPSPAGPPRPCWVSRQPRKWAPLVDKSAPFDMAALGSAGLLVGYARTQTEAMGLEVDLAKGGVSETFKQVARGSISRVFPTPGGTEAFVVTLDGQEGVQSPFYVPGPQPLVVGFGEGGIVTSERADGTMTPVWPKVGGEAEAMRVVKAGEKGHALLLRRDGGVWGGWMNPARSALGELMQVAGSGGSVGKPSLGWNGREVAVVFADRPAGSKAWEIRLGRAPFGQMPAATEVLPLPEGGPGGDAFAPDIAGLADGRWVLVWTEGPAGSRAMRALTLGPDLTPIGDPIALSPPAGNFGQGILGVAGSYVGTVFLSKPAAIYELWGVVMQCG